MAESKEITKYSINPGTMFMVSNDSSDSVFLPGTLGFISYVKGQDRDYHNVMFISVVIIRRGKTGKERLEFGQISTPIFNFDIKNNKNLKDLFPDEKRKQFVKIVPIENYNFNVMKLTDIEFLGWAVAYSQYVFKLNQKVNHFSSWPQQDDNILNTTLRVTDFFADDEDGIKAVLASPKVRKEFVHAIRKQEASLVRCYLLYMFKVNSIEKQAVLEINAHTQKDGKIVEDLKNEYNQSDSIEKDIKIDLSKKGLSVY